MAFNKKVVETKVEEKEAKEVTKPAKVAEDQPDPNRALAWFTAK